MVASLIAAGLLLALHFALWIASLSQTSVASSVVLVTTTPLFVALVSWLLFRERLKRGTFVGIAVSLGGAMLIGYAGMVRGGTALSGNLMALGAALAMAGYLLIGRRVRPRAGLLAYATAVFTVAAGDSPGCRRGIGHSLEGYSAGAYAAMVALALVPQLVGHMSLNWALRFLPATMVTVAVLGEPVGASFPSVVGPGGGADRARTHGGSAHPGRHRPRVRARWSGRQVSILSGLI
jgi:drug/metabolite transporter (DMT)-like permease